MCSVSDPETFICGSCFCCWGSRRWKMIKRIFRELKKKKNYWEMRETLEEMDGFEIAKYVTDNYKKVLVDFKILKATTPQWEEMTKEFLHYVGKFYISNNEKNKIVVRLLYVKLLGDKTVLRTGKSPSYQGHRKGYILKKEEVKNLREPFDKGVNAGGGELKIESSSKDGVYLYDLATINRTQK